VQADTSVPVPMLFAPEAAPAGESRYLPLDNSMDAQGLAPGDLRGLAAPEAGQSLR